MLCLHVIPYPSLLLLSSTTLFLPSNYIYFWHSQILAGICDRVCLPVPKEISFIRLFVVLERGDDVITTNLDIFDIFLHIDADFLQPGLQALKPTGGYVHLYQFTPDDDPFSGPIEKFRKAATNIGIWFFFSLIIKQQNKRKIQKPKEQKENYKRKT